MFNRTAKSNITSNVGFDNKKKNRFAKLNPNKKVFPHGDSLNDQVNEEYKYLKFIQLKIILK